MFTPASIGYVELDTEYFYELTFKYTLFDVSVYCFGVKAKCAVISWHGKFRVLESRNLSRRSILLSTHGCCSFNTTTTLTCCSQDTRLSSRTQQTYVRNITRLAKVASYETSQETSVSFTQLVVLYPPFQFGSDNTFTCLARYFEFARYSSI